MSGIIACSGAAAAAPVLLEGLRRLAHHDHDSAGLALLSRRRLHVWKTLGSVAALEHRLPLRAAGRCGIAHTRLATHGAPSERNAHPQLGGAARVALVHNGIVENADALRRALRADGVDCVSETDTEVLAQLLARRLERHGETLEEAFRAVLHVVHGTCGLAALDREAPGRVVVARVGSPMVLGRGDDVTLAASDPAALRGRARETVSLEDGEIAVLTPTGFDIASLDARTARRRAGTRGGIDGGIDIRADAAADDGIDVRAGDGFDDRTDESAPAAADGDGAGPRLHREIHEQPLAVARALAGRLDRRFSSVRLGGLNLAPERLRDVARVHLLGCGSAWHAALSGAHMIESLARLPATAEPAGEFRHRDPVIERDTLYVVASRSGETFDTLAAAREIRARGGTVLGVVNDVGSSVARAVHGGVYLHAGPERSVVATKSVSVMLAVFALLALLLGRLRDVSPQRGARLLDAFDALPGHVGDVLAGEAHVADVARALAPAAGSVLFVGRGAGYAIALEGARKLSEASGLHAAACPAAELAHGPIALLGAATPCIVLLPEPDLASLSALERIGARGAPLVVIGDGDGQPRVAELADHVVRVPRTEPLLQPIVAGVVLQLLACHAGLALGRDLDRPGSLAGRVPGD